MNTENQTTEHTIRVIPAGEVKVGDRIITFGHHHLAVTALHLDGDTVAFETTEWKGTPRSRRCPTYVLNEGAAPATPVTDDAQPTAAPSAPSKETAMQTTVREIQHQVRINLTDAPKLTNVIGRTRQPLGLRLTYGLRSDITRVDITVEWEDTAEMWPPVADMPDWLRCIIDDHRPADVDELESYRPTGMGGWPVYPAAG
jgi:hypothetical protein